MKNLTYIQSKLTKYSLLVLVVVFNSLSAKAQVSSQERQALVDFYTSTNGANWTNTQANNQPWLINDPNSSVNDWYGVTVVANKVTVLKLDDNNLVGTIPGAISNILGLESLSLNKNTLSGGIPNTIGDLINLKSLSLARNKLTGTIPASISNLSNLTSVSLYLNKLSGVIPSGFWNLSNLKVIHIAFNKLEGTIPVSIGNMSNLTFLYLSGNKLEGLLPSSLGNLTKLGTLAIANNSFSGKIPSGLSAIASSDILNTLEFGGNNFVYSDFETEHANYQTNLTRYLYTPQAEIDQTETRSIPKGQSITLTSAALTSANNSYQWYKDDVAITGATSKDLVITNAMGTDAGVYHCSVTNSIVTGLTLTRNSITVSISSTEVVKVPASERQALIDLYTSTNGANWTNTTANNKPWLINDPNSSVVDWYGVTLVGDKVTGLKLDSNNLVGTIPNSISDLLVLESLSLVGNTLSGNIPTTIGNLVNLKVLSLGRNKLTGSIPISISGLSNLTDLSLLINKLSGPIPSELGSLLNLKVIHIGHNQFEGSIPVNLGNLSKLTFLYLTGNKLEGKIPIELGNLTNLQTLSISDNNLNGVIPSQISNLASLVNFRFRGNGFVFKNFETEHSTYKSKIVNYVFSPQDKVDQTEALSVAANGGITLTSKALTSTNNSYQWYKNDVAIPGATNKDLVISNAKDTDAGVYHFTATNSIITDLTLTRNPITLTIGPAEVCGVPTDDEKQTLNQLYTATNGANWTNNTNWLTDAPLCDWYGVTVVNNAIVSIELPNNNLTGDVSSVLFEFLTNLGTLNLKENNLSGPLNNLHIRKLKVLDISKNNFSGSLDIGKQVISLSYLDASENNFSGEVLLEYFSGDNFASLQYLNISSNQLTGLLPEEFSLLSNIETFDISNNNLTGRVDMSNFVGATKLSKLDLSNNKFDTLFLVNPNDFTNLTSLSLEENEFKFFSLESFYNDYVAKLDVNYKYAPQAKVDQTQTLSVATNGNITLTSTALTSTKNSYQWYKDGVAITGATNKDLVISNAKDTDAGVYYFTATNSIITDLTLTRNPITLTIGPADVCGVSAAERQALIDLYNSTNGANWTNTTANNKPWLINDPTSKVCDWAGVTVENGKLISINISNNNLKGTLPNSINGLVYLKQLYLYSNQLIGNIPSSIGDLIELQTLSLDNNQFTGNIPSSIGNLSNLDGLALYKNQLGGMIPKELGNLLKLRFLFLHSNQISGPIPLELGGLTNVENINLSSNKLIGQIPGSIGNLSQLAALRIGSNEFSGQIPSPISELPNLTVLEFANNNFIFSNFESDFTTFKTKLKANFKYIPQAKVDQTKTLSVIKNGNITLTSTALTSTKNSYQWYKDNVAITGATNKDLVISNAKDTDAGVYHFTATNSIITDLTLTRNPITLSISPADGCGVSAAEKQALIDLYNSTNGANWTNNTNWLSATVPVCDWYGVTVVGSKVTAVELVSNNLVGDIPLGIKGLTNLVKLNLETNQLTGTIPVEIAQLSNLEFLSLNQNDLYKEIPTELELLSKLRSLYLGHNKLTGTIPVSLSKLSNLRYLHLQGNKLSGEIPVALGILSNLTDLNLYSNALTGNIPVELGQLLNLKSLHLDNNQLSGSIPVTFGELLNLVDLNLYNNNLSGDIPVELGNLSKLQSLYIYNNQLSGTIPITFGQLSNLKALDAHNNELTGELPEAISKLSNLESLWVQDNQLSGKIPSTLVTLPKLQLLYLNDNQFVFSDLESDFNAYNLRLGSGFKYFPQGKVDLEEEQPVVLGEEIILGTKALTSSNNSYQWFKNGVAISGAINSTFKITAAKQSDAGIYHFEATNSIVHDLTLERHPITLKITSDVCSVSAREKQALVDFYTQTGGTSWTTKTNWLTDTPVCNWYGVTVVKGKVTEIKLGNNNLTGSLSTSVVALTNLKQLDLSGNQLEGEIPIEIIQLTNLEQIILSNNNFIGNLPKELGQLTQLKQLELSNNQFSGNVPVEFAQLTNLEGLKINDNKLSGSIPTGLAQLVGFKNFDLFGNQFIFSEVEPTFVALQTKLGAGFSYSPQAKVDQEEIIPAVVGEPITLTSIALTSTKNSYQWYKDNVAITGATNKDFVIASASATDAGVYHFTSTNSVVVGLTLTRHQIKLEVGTTSCEISATERQALIDIYNTTNGANWANTLSNNKPWLINDPNSKVCDWYGVSVANGKVTSLRLIKNTLTGNIPSSLFQLVGLKDVQLSDNQLTGVLPVELLSLTKLQTLHISNNKLEGVIPENIGQLSNLEHLLLSNNTLIGGIPKSLGQITKLVDLQLNSNQLTGSIPEELGGLSNLRSITISNNQLSGEIPATFTQLTNLEVFKIDNNQLSGNIPAGFDQFAGFRNFSIFGNQFVFSGIEPTFGVLKTKLGTGFIYDPQAKVDETESRTIVAGLKETLTSNILTSTNNGYQWYKDGVAIPGATNKELVFNTINESDAGVYHFAATNSIVTGLTIERNSITISIAPADSCGVSASEKQGLIDFYNTTNGPTWTNNTNWLSNTVPVCDWYGVTVVDGKVTALSLPKNNVSGEIHTSISQLVNLTTLRLNDNRLSGRIPSTLGKLSSLQHLYLSWNHLTGEIPSDLGKLKGLRTLEAMGNQLTGNIPVELGNLTSLERFSLYRNLLTGTIPVELSNLLNLKYLSLSDNQLSGSIPALLGNLTKLEELSLFRNQLSESIPVQLGQLSSLKHLYLNHNQLSGSIPVEFGALSNLQFLWLSTNELTNNIPVELGNLRKLQDFKANDNQLSGRIPATLGNVLSLKYIELARNQLSGPIPVQFGQLTNLEQLYLSENQLSGRIPKVLSQLSSLKHMMIDSNRFVFWNVEPEFNTYKTNLTSFLYAPQAKVDNVENHTIYTGKSITFTSNALTSSNNSYQWYKNGVAISGATSKDFIITNATTVDAGVYYFTATNSVVTGLTLVRNSITLSVLVPNWDSTQSFCSSEKIPTVSDLVSPISNTPTVKWYETQTGGTELIGTTELDPIVYWAEGNTSNPRVGVKVNLDEDAPGIGEEDYQAFSILSNSKIKDLKITGTNISWYSAATGGMPLDINTVLEDKKSYFAQQGTASCRFEVVVAVKVFEPEGDGWQYFCKSEGTTIANLGTRYTILSGHTLIWYKTATGTETYTSAEGLVDKGVYYAVQRDPLNNESTRKRITVSIFDVPSPIVTNKNQIFYTNDPVHVSDLVATGNNILWYDAAFGGTAYSPTEKLVDGRTYYAAQTDINCTPGDIGCCTSTFREEVTVTIKEELPPSLIGCERFRPQPGEHYVISAWVREDGLQATNPIIRNFSEVSNVFVDLLNHIVKDKILASVVGNRHIPEIYVPKPDSREFDVLIPFLKNAVDKNLTIYDFKYVKERQDGVGPERTVGFEFSLVPGKKQAPQFRYTTPYVKGHSYSYPLLNNPTLALNFTGTSICGTKFCMTSSFKIDGGSLSYNRNNIVNTSYRTSGMFSKITKYTYTIDPDYQAMEYVNSLLRLRYRNKEGIDINPQNRTDIEFKPKGAIVDGWQRVSADFTIPLEATNMQIRLESNIQGDGLEQLNIYFDDIRMHPFKGNMKTFVYDPITQRLKSELDENNYATFYEYDQEGGLIRVKKETEKGVFTIQETRSGNSKLNGQK
ncbi:Leucine-rich repeat (LRR) protein [Aquimarina sp. MAR_2010_214]|uniref:leucine-rich repeat domain-containing protein n=1 Tax=Aquimarina sp. MAR_2010_214 TaxID=1250026 RepID=UPI000C713637|nr:leucine-rich repeat domain-containing protein [Aquimarina sp. MAR_2010_214]PKV51938.1 Leucine-rich repeat (LRR) protein [Aquimarina sp. MAR_2010_214]